ncbi:hypothetical protein [Thalassomonas haliotis]|uniref:Lipid/polyisoprenoid-binding YceI-like domain-containing protein n=1 Tax=Thalassomonas haliotis TaxID=485448 RepID=A0ABY7VGS7_9GAMM|nr:hypothetical protein [Thalassomonas haliotis]WDE11877.1 hypothetical protein H3N35_27435 [Thalassomonas haliotis]
MKLFNTLLLMSLAVFSGRSLADTVYVNGTLHTLAKSDFVQSGDNYTAYIDVIGDYGQQLIFDIDAIVGGDGYQEVTYVTEVGDRCIRWNGRKTPDFSTCIEYNLIEVPVYSNDFRYMTELQVSCSGIAIGSDMDNKNALVNGQVTDTYRETKLLVTKQKNTGGSCQQLKVDIKGLELAAINNISLDVLIAEAF